MSGHYEAYGMKFIVSSIFVQCVVHIASRSPHDLVIIGHTAVPIINVLGRGGGGGRWHANVMT